MSFSKIPHIKPRRQVFFLLIIEIAFRRKGKVYILVINEKPNGHIMENLFVASVFWSFFSGKVTLAKWMYIINFLGSILDKLVVTKEARLLTFYFFFYISLIRCFKSWCFIWYIFLILFFR